MSQLEDFILSVAFVGVFLLAGGVAIMTSLGVALAMLGLLAIGMAFGVLITMQHFGYSFDDDDPDEYEEETGQDEPVKEVKGLRMVA